MNKINHLYWRAGFGLSPQEWVERKDWSIKKAVNELFAEAKKVPSLTGPSETSARFMQASEEEKKALLKQARQNVVEQNVAWVLRMGSPDHPALLERMTLFWHGHFACRSRSGKLAVQQLNTIREHALGDFKSLVLGIARNPAMIRYLNNQQNRKEQPNENFARELMELFTLGRGHYTEQDIKEAARAFTGWSSNLKGEFVFRRFWHDPGTKTFMGKNGRFGGEDIIDMILEKPACAKFITRKIYAYFVNDKVDERRVQDLSRQFYRSGYDIAGLMRTIFSSDWFYADKNRGNKIKSPVELIAGMTRAFGIKYQQKLTIPFLEKALGQVLFNPPNVAGWPGGKSWIDNSTLMMRLNLANSMIGSTEFNFRAKGGLEEKERKISPKKIQVKANVAPLIAITNQSSKKEAIYSLAQYLLLNQPKLGADMIEQYAPLKDNDQFITLASIRLMSLPEYQMC